MTNKYEREIALNIKKSYETTTPEKTKLNELKELDHKVKTPARVFAYIFGAIGALILGTGMCLAMKIIGDLMVLGIIIGLVGIAMVSICYPLYVKILESRKAKYKDEIISKSNELLNDNEKKQ